MKRGNGAIRIGVAGALLFASLSLVVWRQSRALEALRGLDAARNQRAMMQWQRADLEREIQMLESLPRMLDVAGTRFGMRMPSADEIVILKSPAYADATSDSTSRPARGLLSAVER